MKQLTRISILFKAARADKVAREIKVLRERHRLGNTTAINKSQRSLLSIKSKTCTNSTFRGSSRKLT